MLRHSWLVQTFRFASCCPSIKRAKAAENCGEKGTPTEAYQSETFKYQGSGLEKLFGSSYLFAPWRKAAVAPQASLHVVRALSVPTQVDGSGLDVDVHQVVDNLALDVVLDPVDEEAPAHVDHLDEGKISGGRQPTLELEDDDGDERFSDSSIEMSVDD